MRSGQEVFHLGAGGRGWRSSRKAAALDCGNCRAEALAFEQLAHFNITKAFVSAFGLDDKTATTNHEHQVEMLRKALDAADKRYLILDHTKIGRKGLYRIAARGGFDAIFTDRPEYMRQEP